MMPETAKRTARVPILGEDGRISDDYIPAAIGEGVESAEAAATRAETAAAGAEASASAAGQSAAQASGSASAASASASQAQQSATAAGGAATSAQSAQTAAEAAQSAAAGSAQDAQQSATAAQQSAASVADKFITSAEATTLEPGSQATASVENQVLTIGVPKGDKGDTGEKGDTGTGVPEGGEPGQLLSKTDSGTAWVDPPSGNVLTGTLGPAPVLSADDAYATKPRRLTVYGETRQNLWVNPTTRTANGVTLTANDDGSITVGGTSTASVSTYFDASHIVYALKPETTYTLSVDKAFTGMYVSVREDDSSGAVITTNSVQSGALTFQTKANMASCLLFVAVGAGTTVSGTYRVMLNEGSEAEPWCPPGLNGVEELSVVTAGKNLLPIRNDMAAVTRNGITFTPNKDGTVTVNGTATANDVDYYVVGNTWNGHAGVSLPASDLVFSTNGIAKLYGYDSDSTLVISIVLNDGQQRIAASAAQACSKMIVYLSYANGRGETNKDVYVQLELGSTATDYEPPNVTTTPLPEVELRSLPDGTCDELVIKADGTCEVERRTQEIILDGSSTWNSVGNGQYWSFKLINNGYVNAGMYEAPAICDKLPVDSAVDGGIYVSDPMGSSLYIIGNKYGSTPEEVAGYFASNVTTVVTTISEDSTKPQSPVTLPVLPAPTFNVYHDSQVPSDTSVEYARDINIVIDNLAKKIAGTAATVAINEATR